MPDGVERCAFLCFAGGKIYRTPHGYHWKPIELDINRNFRSHSPPDFGVASDELENLETMTPE